MEILLNREGALQKIHDVTNSKDALEVVNVEIDGSKMSVISDFVETYEELNKIINAYKILLQNDINNTESAVDKYNSLDQKLSLGFASSLDMMNSK